jgi:NADPH-dependent ferric siderophore reductase
MARFSSLVKPESQDLLHLTVLRTERLSPHWTRITLGGGDISRFRPLGYDQWFRIFLPMGGDEGLERIPAKANKIFGYLKYLRIPDGMRPVMRNYTVRAYRAQGDSGGPEIDVDFVLHGTGPTAGPASRWADAAAPGESVVIIDEGLGFNPERGVDRVALVADETGAPAVAGVCASLPPTATGFAIIEAPSAEDILPFDAPDGIEVQWIVREPGVKPGTLALASLHGPRARLHRRRAGPPHRRTPAPGRRARGGQERRQLRRLLARRRRLPRAEVAGGAVRRRGPPMSRVSTAYLLTCAAIGVAGGILLLGGWLLSLGLFATVPFASIAIAGIYVIPAVIALRLLQRPLAGLLVGLISGLVLAPFYTISAVATTLFWSFFPELPFLATLLAAQSFDLWSMTPVAFVAFIVLCVASCFAGTALGILIGDRLRRAGVARLARRRDPAASATTTG